MQLLLEQYLCWMWNIKGPAISANLMSACSFSIASFTPRNSSESKAVCNTLWLADIYDKLLAPTQTSSWRTTPCHLPISYPPFVEPMNWGQDTNIVLFSELFWSYCYIWCELCPVHSADIHWPNFEIVIFQLYWDLSAYRRTHLERGFVTCFPEMARATLHLRTSWILCQCSVSKLQGTSKSFMHLRYMVRKFLFLYYHFLRVNVHTLMTLSLIAK